MKVFRIFLMISLLALLLWVPACKKKQQPPPKPAAAAKAAAPAAPAPELVAETKVEREIYVYEPKGRRDPFTSLIDTSKEKAFKAGAAAIETFDVEEMKLIAIVWDNVNYYAQVVLPDKKSYTLRKGMKIGLYGGTVHEITPDSVVIREEFTDFKGQRKSKDIILQLRKEGDE